MIDELKWIENKSLSTLHYSPFGQNIFFLHSKSLNSSLKSHFPCKLQQQHLFIFEMMLTFELLMHF